MRANHKLGLATKEQKPTSKKFAIWPCQFVFLFYPELVKRTLGKYQPGEGGKGAVWLIEWDVIQGMSFEPKVFIALYPCCIVL